MDHHNRKHSSTSVILRFRLLDETKTDGSGLTGLAYNSSGLVIATIADGEATATVYEAGSSEIETIATLGTYAAPTAGKCRFKELDSTNMPGWYELHLADARFAVSGADYLDIHVRGAANLVPHDVHVELIDLPANVTKISDDATAADDLETAIEGTTAITATLASTGLDDISMTQPSGDPDDFRELMYWVAARLGYHKVTRDGSNITVDETDGSTTWTQQAYSDSGGTQTITGILP